jgi:hypothetical protein
MHEQDWEAEHAICNLCKVSLTEGVVRSLDAANMHERGIRRPNFESSNLLMSQVCIILSRPKVYALFDNSEIDLDNRIEEPPSQGEEVLR